MNPVTIMKLFLNQYPWRMLAALFCREIRFGGTFVDRISCFFLPDQPESEAHKLPSIRDVCFERFSSLSRNRTFATIERKGTGSICRTVWLQVNENGKQQKQHTSVDFAS